MNFVKKFVIILVLFLIAFIAYTLMSTGYFRTIEPIFDGKIIKEVFVKGAEDIMVSIPDSFALISATDRADRSAKKKDGGLYFIDLKSDNFTPIPLTASINFAFEPHGVSFYKKDSIYHIMAINHANKSHSIELFELNKRNLTHKRTLRDASMIQPNDLVMIDENRFYFTNDHGYTEGIGKAMEEYLGLAVSNVIYFDGENYREVAENIAYANGINFDKNRNLLFVASPRRFSIKVYSKQEDGTLSFIEDIPCKTGVDNIEFDNENNLWIGCHPNLLKLNAYRRGKAESAPSEIIKVTYVNKGDFSIEKIYVDDGYEMSGSTVAAVYNNILLVGNIMDEKFLILQMN